MLKYSFLRHVKKQHLSTNSPLVYSTKTISGKLTVREYILMTNLPIFLPVRTETEQQGVTLSLSQHSLTIMSESFIYFCTNLCENLPLTLGRLGVPIMKNVEDHWLAVWWVGWVPHCFCEYIECTQHERSPDEC